MTTKLVNPDHPVIIQGGMGFNVSTWYLARIVSMLGGLGTISGVALERVLAIILQNGDPGGHFREALRHFPFPHIAEMVLKAYFIEEGNPKNLKRQSIPIFQVNPRKMWIALNITANFAAVWLAKRDNPNKISINYLYEIRPHLYAILGAMLAGVDFITVGAGIPLQISDIINAIYEGRTVKFRVALEGEKEPYEMSFDSELFLGGKLPPMKKPRFLPIVSSHVLAMALVDRLPPGSIYGFVVELPTAGGHNAPPRGMLILTPTGEPVYGLRDIVDWKKIKALGLPFWIGGSMASPEMLAWARSEEIGATGIQVGTAFAFCEESGLAEIWKKIGRKLAFQGKYSVFTDILASPAGYPFKIANIPGTASDPLIRNRWKKVCRHKVLARPYRRPDGTVGYRCPAEPEKDFLRKGGNPKIMKGKLCICSNLMAAVGLGTSGEIAVITSGDDVSCVRRLLKHEDDTYRAADVFRDLNASRSLVA